jgi:hypothetical protein
LCNGRGLDSGLNFCLKFSGQRGTDLDFDSDGGAGFVAGSEADDSVRRPGWRDRGGEMELHFATNAGGECGCCRAGNLAEKFFQSFFLLGSNAFESGSGSRLGFAEELAGETCTGCGRQTQCHLAMDGASDNDRVPDIGIGGSQELGRNFEDGRLSRNLRKHILETGLPSFTPVA